MSVRRARKPLAYFVSLLVLGAAAWMPTSVLGQSLPGNANTPGGGGATFPVSDEVFKVCDNGDPTKCAELEASSITTGNVSTLTVQQGDYTIAGTNLTNTFSSDQIVSSGVRWFFGAGAGNNYNAPVFNTAQTPDGALLGTGALANSWILAEVADAAFNFNNGPGAGAALVQPALIAESEDQSATQYTAYQAGAISTQRRVTLTEAGGAEQLFQITTATTQSGGGEIDYKIHVTDGTDFAVRQGKIRFVFYNAAGTVTATISGADQTADGSVAIVSAGETLTYALTSDVATANVYKFMINIDSNITVNAAHADYIVTYNGPGEVVFP